jgi:thiol-disulfide isomerase/thioredoxin
MSVSTTSTTTERRPLSCQSSQGCQRYLVFYGERPLTRRLAGLVGGLLLALAMVAGCSGGGGTAGGTQQGGTANSRFVSGTGAVTTMPVGDRRSAPPLSGKSLDGKQISLSDFKGRVVVVNVWGSWCAPCRKEAPDLVAASKALRARHVAFLGINTRDLDPGPARAFVRRFAVPYPSIYDPHGEQLLGFRDTLPPSAIPSTVVIDTQGRVAARVLGPMTKRTVEDLAHDVVESG